MIEKSSSSSNGRCGPFNKCTLFLKVCQIVLYLWPFESVEVKNVEYPLPQASISWAIPMATKHCKSVVGQHLTGMAETLKVLRQPPFFLFQFLPFSSFKSEYIKIGSPIPIQPLNKKNILVLWISSVEFSETFLIQFWVAIDNIYTSWSYKR